MMEQKSFEEQQEELIEFRGRARSRSFLSESESTEPVNSQNADQEIFNSHEEEENSFRGRSRSRSFLSENGEIEGAMGRCRSKSFSENNSKHDSGGEEEATMIRRRSRSFVSTRDGQASSSNEVDTHSLSARAASLSKIYLAGGTPVGDVDYNPKKITGKPRQAVQQTGALSAKALDALSEGLHDNIWNTSSVVQLSQEELEEKELAEQEAQILREEKAKKLQVQQKRRVTSLKGRMFNRWAPNEQASSSAASSTASGASTTTSHDEIVAQPTKRHKLKLLLLGDSGVGKTSLMRVFSGDPFSESMLATAGVDFKLRNVTVNNEQIALQLWDTAGQERFHRITATYYKGASGIVLVYDVNDKQTFENVGYWMTNIDQYSSPNLPAMLLVGNKIDLPNRVITASQGEAVAAKYGIRFLETSAKTSENVEQALFTISKDALHCLLDQKSGQKDLIQREKLAERRRQMKEKCCIA